MKVLIISHNPLSTYQSMGKTMCSLFSDFKKDELFQLYIYPSVPDVDKCHSYFRMTDKAVAKGVFTRRVECGAVKPNLEHHTKFENDKDKFLYNNPKNTQSFRLLARDIMWRVSPWWNNELKQWLDEIQPDCIFLAPGNCAFIYDVALRISKVYDIRIVSYICDEYYFINTSSEKTERLRATILRKKIAETMIASDRIITICNELENEYAKTFGDKVNTIMTGASLRVSSSTCMKEKIASITFMGNLSCNRDIPAYEIGKALDRINNNKGTHYIFKIYTNLTDKIRDRFKDVESVELYDFVSGLEFEKVFWNSEMFLHIEDFQNNSIDRVKHSVSTKIADVLSSGIPMFAYGPASVASMAHLLRNESAICVTDKKQLEDALVEAFSNKSLRAQTVERALVTAKAYHVSDYNSQRLKTIMLEVCLRKVEKNEKPKKR